MECSLNDFAQRNPLNAIIAKNMVNLDILGNGLGRFEDKACFCFSAAYQICRRLIEESPAQIWILPDLYKKALYNIGDKDLKSIMQAVTLSIVLILTEHLPDEWKTKNNELRDEILKKIKNIYVEGETSPFVSGLMLDMRASFGFETEAVSSYKILRHGTAIDYVLTFEEFTKQGATPQYHLTENALLAAVQERFAEAKSMIPHFEYDKQNEKMKIVQGVEKKGVDFSEKEKEYKKQIEDLKTEVESLRSEIIKQKKIIDQTSASIDIEEAKKIKKEAEHYKSLYEVADKQVKRYEEEFVPLDEIEKIDWHEQFSIKERIIFFQALTGCNLNEKEKKYGNQTQKALLIARFSGNDSNKIRSVISKMSGEIEAVEKGELQEFSEGIRGAALNVYMFLHKAVKGDTFGSKPYQCRQAMENINKIYHLKLEDKKHLPPPKDTNFLAEPKPEE